MNKQNEKTTAPGADVGNRQHNLPPEAISQQLAPVEDIPAIIKADIDKAKNEAALELATYARVPDVIESSAIYERVVALATRLKKVADNADASRKKHKAPYLLVTSAIDSTFKLEIEDNGVTRKLSDELGKAHTSLKARLSAYDTPIYLAEQKRIAEEHEVLAAAAAKDGIVLDETAARQPKTVSSVRSAHGGLSVRSIVQDWRVVDEESLPRSILSVDPIKVKALLDSGAKKIPGIEITDRVNTHVKAK